MNRALLFFCGLLFPLSARAVDFTREVLPILADNCFHCHGPDEKARKGKLRLDTKEGAFRVRDGESIIVPGKSDKSELIRRLVTHEADELMPPPSSNRKLTQPQIDLLKKWVNEGAAWGQPWYLTPLKAPPIPTTPGVVASTPIDAFIRARLAKEGLPSAPPATREMWARRVAFDLTGLPPTPAEVDAFLADTTPEAFGKFVDRLLSSERYGERMAADWLDVARFADTHGYQSDRARPVWPYRDWVIRSFNKNQKFDEFLTWQLAGDLMPSATKEQRLATAFNRLHMQNEEGGIVEEEFRVAYVVDRVNTFATAFLGLTTECSRCHDHKYDPLTMKDFYSLFAFFQNIDESGQTSYFTSATPVPALLLSNDAQDKKIAELRSTIDAREKALAAAIDSARQQFASWKKPADPSIPGLVAAYSFDGLTGNQAVNSVDAKKPGKGHEAPQLMPGKVGQAVSLNGENGFEFPGVGHFTKADPFSLALWIRPTLRQPRMVVAHHSRAPIDAGSRGYELLLENGRVAFGLHHMWPGNSLKVVTRAEVPLQAWTHVTATYDGSGTAAGVRLYIDGKLAELEVVRDGLRKDITYGGEPNLAIGYRFRDNGFKGGAIDEFRVYDRALTAAEAGHVSGSQPLGTAKDLFEYYVSTAVPDVLKQREELRAARRALNDFVNGIPEIMVMEEMARPRPAFMLTRGEYDRPGAPVSADVPGALPKFPVDAPRNRLGLARWLTQPEHPLTARVTVNRFWQQMFGRGIVETADNFGSTGSGATHPELLDWLAADFVANGWDVKRLLKMIALSDTYRQSSTIRKTKEAGPENIDPETRLYWRMPPRRLTAEMLRDQALFVSGLLVEKQGGPSVYPYQPDGLWNEAMGRPNYPRSTGADLYRRGLYTFWKRTAPPPTMTAFDAADRSVCSARRQSTSTPLQALALLNETSMIESARFLGERMLKEGGKTRAEQAAWAFRVVATRRPTEKETAVLTRLFDEQASAYESDPAGVGRLAGIGDKKNDASVNRTELAAATLLALAILNHDAAVMRR